MGWQKRAIPHYERPLLMLLGLAQFIDGAVIFLTLGQCNTRLPIRAASRLGAARITRRPPEPRP